MLPIRCWYRCFRTDEVSLFVSMHLYKNTKLALLLDSDNIVAYVRFLASAYIRLTPEMHDSVFHPDDPSTVISPPDFCSVYVEQMGQDAGKSNVFKYSV